MDVLIVGAGPTGLTAAVEFARRGIRARLVEKRPTASPWSRAVGILPRSLEILEPSGVSAALREEGIRVGHARFFLGGEQILAVPMQIADHDNAYMLALPQDRTELHLADAFRRYDGQVHYGVALTGLTPAEDHVSVTLEGDGADALPGRYHYVLGADGTDSMVRQALGIDYEGYDLPQTWSIADVEADGWPYREDFAGFLLEEGRVCVVVPIGTGRYRVIADTPDALATVPVPLEVTRIRREGTFRISVRQAARYGIDRVWLAGDAAHCHSPVGGRGMNLGIADAAAFVRHFEAGTLRQYSFERHAEGRAVLDLTERARKAISARNPLMRSLAIGAMKLVNAVPALQRRAAATVLDL